MKNDDFSIIKEAFNFVGIPYRTEKLRDPTERIIILHGVFTNQIRLIFRKNGKFKKME